DFVGFPQRKIVLDLSHLADIELDERSGGVRIGAGSTVGAAQKSLFRQWGATLPLGACSAVGLGGLVAGGGYGTLSRQWGLVADHLAAVDVAVVNADRQVQLVRATREDVGPRADLFWAHTGGGGGNFGIVTAYEFRSPDELSHSPVRLPQAAAGLNVRKIMYPWAMLDESAFCTLVRRFFQWHEQHSSAAEPESGVFATFFLHHKSAPFLQLMVQSDAQTDPEGRILEEFVASLTAQTHLRGIPRGGQMTWLTGTRYMSQADCGDVMGARSASKSAYHRKCPSDEQLARLYAHLTDEHPGHASYIMVNSYGGRINLRSREDTASPQRDSIAKSSWFSAWLDPEHDDLQLNWLRHSYEDFFSETGGVPLSNAQTDGCYINYPDHDLRDPERNRSSATWHDLYYAENYPRLLRAKKYWDPTNVFHHSMSIAS
ncbi:MAG: BBE domain-containing protein, partial [Angustibacter sp.]